MTLTTLARRNIKMLVCGGRKYSDMATLFTVLDRIHMRRTVSRVCHGGASGADSLAGKWAKSRYLDVIAYPAAWRTFGKGAGIVRNGRMLDEFKPDLVVAFPGGIGTAHMMRISDEAGVPVIAVSPEGEMNRWQSK